MLHSVVLNRNLRAGGCFEILNSTEIINSRGLRRDYIGQEILDKRTKLRKTCFSMECFTAGFSRIFSTCVKVWLLGGRLGPRFPKTKSFNSFISSRDNSYIDLLVIIIQLSFFCGKTKLCSKVKRFANVFSKIVGNSSSTFKIPSHFLNKCHVVRHPIWKKTCWNSKN